MKEDIKYFTVEDIKTLRVAIDLLIQEIEKPGTSDTGPVDATGGANYDLYFKAKDTAHTKLIEAKMWCGKMLEGLGTPFPANLADKANGPVTVGSTTANETLTTTGSSTATPADQQADPAPVDPASQDGGTTAA